MDGTLQERDLCWLGLFAGHGAHSAGACCALCVEAEFRHCSQPGHHAHTCPLNRQHILTPASAKDALAQHHARHCSVCGGSKAHTYRLARTYAHTHAHKHIHTRMRTHTHIQTQTRANTHRCAHKHAHAHAQTHRHTHGRTYKRPNTQAHTRAHMHVHTHANTHTCICMHMLLA